MACPRATGPKFKDMRTSIWEVFLNGVLLEQIKKTSIKLFGAFWVAFLNEVLLEQIKKINEIVWTHQLSKAQCAMDLRD